MISLWVSLLTTSDLYKRQVQDLSEHAKIVDGDLTYTGTASQAPSIVIGPSQSKELPKDLQLHFDTKEPVSYTHLSNSTSSTSIKSLPAAASSFLTSS